MHEQDPAMIAHAQWRGKIEIGLRAPVRDARDLALAYTPGVALPCKAIEADPTLAYTYTRKWNTVAVVTDGTAVLGLGDIGPLAGLPVMEGKAVLFKAFGGVDAIPILVDTKDVDEIVDTVRRIAPTFGGINLEDIGAPRCFEVERRLRAALDIPVFHDDQHGTAIVVVAALSNALLLSGRKPQDVRVVVNGAGAAGVASARLFARFGVRDIVLCDRQGAIYAERPDLDETKAALARDFNPSGVRGDLAEALRGAHVFIGLSAPGVLTADMVRGMAADPIVFAMANPVPEIMPDEARAGGARLVGTGRSDFPNQINNVLAFPGVFRGALDVRARDIDERMKLAAAHAIAELARPELREDYLLPAAFDERVGRAVAEAVAKAARESGLARV